MSFCRGNIAIVGESMTVVLAETFARLMILLHFAWLFYYYYSIIS